MVCRARPAARRSAAPPGGDPGRRRAGPADWLTGPGPPDLPGAAGLAEGPWRRRVRPRGRGKGVARTWGSVFGPSCGKLGSPGPAEGLWEGFIHPLTIPPGPRAGGRGEPAAQGGAQGAGRAATRRRAAEGGGGRGGGAVQAPLLPGRGTRLVNWKRSRRPALQLIVPSPAHLSSPPARFGLCLPGLS